jgi:hypothetical protein
VPLGGDDPLFPLLHAVYGQLRDRVRAELGATLPSPESAMLHGVDVLDPAWWLVDRGFGSRESGLRPVHVDAARLVGSTGRDVVGRRLGDPLPFYAAMFGGVVHPAMLADLARLDAADRPDPANRALTGRALQSDAVHTEVLTDGRRGLRRMAAPAPVDRAVVSSGSAEPWFGIAWDAPAALTSLRARIGEGGGEPTASVVAWDVRVGEVWREVGRAVPTGADLTLELGAPQAADAVRLRVVAFRDDQPAECLELEAR